MAIRAAIFDMDGVLTDTMEAHFAAWKSVFDTMLAERGGGQDRAFSRADYYSHVDGVPRVDGIRNFVASRSLSLPEGAPGDDGLDTIHGLGNRKNAAYLDWLNTRTVPVHDDAVALARRLGDAGVALGVFSASRNAGKVLEKAGLAGLFETRVDGVAADELGLAGKPDPAMLVATASRLGRSPDETVVIEDAELGVRAGKAGGFALVVGVNRSGDAAHGRALQEAGADMVTDNLVDVLDHDRLANVTGGDRRRP